MHQQESPTPVRWLRRNKLLYRLKLPSKPNKQNRTRQDRTANITIRLFNSSPFLRAPYRDIRHPNVRSCRSGSKVSPLWAKHRRYVVVGGWGVCEAQQAPRPRPPRATGAGPDLLVESTDLLTCQDTRHTKFSYIRKKERMVRLQKVDRGRGNWRPVWGHWRPMWDQRTLASA